MIVESTSHRSTHFAERQAIHSIRYSSIDILRMVAVFVMVFVHFGENLAGDTVSFAGLGAPLFAFLSGVSYHLWVQGQQRKGRSDTDISKVSIRRGLFVFGVGIVFNILVWLPEDVFNWDVLTFIGVGLILLNFVRSLPLIVTLAMAAAILMISPILRESVDYHAYWTDRYFDPDLTLSDVTIGFFATGYFPLFPWLTFPLVGFVTSCVLFPDYMPSDADEKLYRAQTKVLSLGVLGIVWTCLVLLFAAYLPATFSQKLMGGWTMFPPTTTYVVAMLSANLVLLVMLHRWVDLNSAFTHSRWLEVPKMFSQYSFTIYVAHHLVHVWPLWIYATITGKETTFYWRNALPSASSYILAVIFLVATYFVLRSIGKQRKYGIEASMRWLCDS